MRLTVAIPATMLTICAALIAYGLLAAPARSRSDAAEGPRTGVELLRSVQCRQAETKRILIRGVEDGFSPLGDEPNYIRPARRSAFNETFFRGGSYDQYQADLRFTDSFEVPANVASGLFVISLRKVANNDTDTIGVGDLTSRTVGQWGGRQLATGVTYLQRMPGWRIAGPLHFANLSEIRFTVPHVKPAGSPTETETTRPYATLIDYIRAARTTAWVDVAVQDDTSVDFMGLALCLEPERGKGLTLAASDGPTGGAVGTVFLACRQVGDESPICDPYKGDTPCDAARPLACIKPGDAPLPRGLETTQSYWSWSGGTIAATDPVAGNRFATVRDADRYCAGRFGDGWRTAAFHDGVREGITAFGDRKAISARVWVDIVDQPYATCWAR